MHSATQSKNNLTDVSFFFCLASKGRDTRVLRFLLHIWSLSTTVNVDKSSQITGHEENSSTVVRNMHTNMCIKVSGQKSEHARGKNALHKLLYY